MKILIQNITEALSGQNRAIEKRYVSFIFSLLKKFIEEEQPEQLFNGSDIHKDLPFDKKLIKKIDKYNEINKKQIQNYSTVSFEFKRHENWMKKPLSFRIYGGFESSHKNEFFHLMINVEIYLSTDMDRNIQFFKRLYPNIINNLQEVVHHEFVHLYQFLDKNARREMDDSGLSKRDKSTKSSLKDPYDGAGTSMDPFFSYDEIEAFAKGLVYAYKKSQDTHISSFCEFAANSIYNKSDQILGMKILFYEQIIEYVSKFFPKISIKDAARHRDRLEQSIKANIRNEKGSQLIKRNRSS